MEFSEKYKPLFDLLQGKHPEVEIVLISGGRDSGKTYAGGVFITTGAVQYNHRVLYTRYTMSSTNNSIAKALDNRMNELSVSEHFDFANNEYTSKINKGLISVTGQKTSSGQQTAKLKSLEGYSIFVTEEGEELTNYDEWEKIKRSIRPKDVQALSVIIFNPPTKNHMLYSSFYEKVPEGFNGVIGNIMYIHTTYLDNGKENMALHNWREYERLRLNYEYYNSLSTEEKKCVTDKIERDYKNYKNTVLGVFRETAEGVIFNYKIGEFVDGDYNNIYGMDQGYNDPTALVKVNVDNKNKIIYLKECYFETEKTESEIYEEIKGIVKTDLVVCDNQAKMFIQGLKRRGLKIRPCNKPKINERIYMVLDYELIVDKDSKNLIDELNNYAWSDKNKDEPIDKHNHAIDAFMYAAVEKINKRSSNVV